MIYLLDEVQEVKVSKHAYTNQWREQWHLLKTTVYKFSWLIISAINDDEILVQQLDNTLSDFIFQTILGCVTPLLITEWLRTWLQLDIWDPSFSCFSCGKMVCLCVFKTRRNKTNVMYLIYKLLKQIHLTTQFFLSLHLLYIFNDNNELLLILLVQQAKTKLQKFWH